MMNVAGLAVNSEQECSHGRTCCHDHVNLSISQLCRWPVLFSFLHSFQGFPGSASDGLIPIMFHHGL